MSDTIRTVAHAYQFNTRNAGELAEYEALCVKLSAMGLECFETHGGTLHHTTGRKIDGRAIDLETSHIFDNQWNTAPMPGISDNGLRVMDWAQDYRPGGSPTLKQGYWLEQTAEMAEVRRNTVGCGYCGKQEPAQKGYVFCPHCIGSEYLQRKELRLTRMVNFSERNPKRAELSEAESAYLVPLYVEAQTHGHTERDKARIAKQRADLVKERDNAIRIANIKHDGFIWLMNNGIKTDNCIYYSHTDRFSFGWRKPVDADVVLAILEVISEFPFSYEIKCADGRTLSN